jgi:hypothetical protein
MSTLRSPVQWAPDLFGAAARPSGPGDRVAAPPVSSGLNVNGPGGEAEVDLVADRVLVLEQDEEAGEQVADQALRTEGQRAAEQRDGDHERAEGLVEDLDHGEDGGDPDHSDQRARVTEPRVFARAAPDRIGRDRAEAGQQPVVRLVVTRLRRRSG